MIKQGKMLFITITALLLITSCSSNNSEYISEQEQSDNIRWLMWKVGELEEKISYLED